MCLLAMMAAAGLGLPVTAAAARMADAPEFVAPETKPIPKGTRVDVVADRLTYDGRADVATATGTVQLTYGPYVLTATKVVYDMKKGVFTANGSIMLREPNGNVVEADFAELKENFREGFARHVRALLTNDVTITAQYARRFENGIVVYEKASYTACVTCVSDGGTPAWQIVAREAKHDLNERTIYYRDARLELGGVPVFWTPYLAYPDPTVRRRTGFLLPSFHGGSYGLGVTTPYFWAVAPNMDMTFSPMWTTEQGVLADVEWRHRLADGMYRLRGFGIYELDPDDSAAADGPWRGAVKTDGDFRINRTWSWGWDATVTSDRSFLSDYDLDDRNMAASSVHATGLEDRNYTKAQIIGWRTLTRDEDQEELPVALPFITGDYVLDQPVFGGELAFRFNAYSLTREKSVDDPWRGLELGTEQTHAMAYAEWKRQMISDSGLLVTPFAQIRSDAFFSENVPDSEDQDDPDIYLMPTAGFDVRMPMIASHGSMQSVLTPVFQMFAAPSEQRDRDNANEDAITLNFDTSSLFLNDRFSGFDRQEGGVRANAGVNYTLMGANGGFLRASFGESFHIAGENSFAAGSGLEGTSSDLVGALALQVNEYLTLGYQARVEEDLSRINVQEATLGLTFDQFSGSLSYADVAAAANYGRPDDERQIWADGTYHIDEVWSVFGGARYDLKEERFMDQSVGVAFECDCMRAELKYSMSRDDEFGPDEEGTEHRIDLGIELRTIGGLSGGFKL
ncbi:LPS-assembly protein LptD [Aestuariivirga sp.]|uniref:LPS-assembly protein LptD n=1 Tax=Aestuariivirga sp. TaxID=2650926 RepID=UPI0039190A6E